MNVPGPGVWSAGKEAEHVADGAVYHQWTVRHSLGQEVPARPHIERARLTAERSQRDVVDLLVRRTNDSVALIAGLSDEQLDLPVRPLRARSPTLGQMIAKVLIGHYAVRTTRRLRPSYARQLVDLQPAVMPVVAQSSAKAPSRAELKQQRALPVAPRPRGLSWGACTTIVHRMAVRAGRLGLPRAGAAG